MFVYRGAIPIARKFSKPKSRIETTDGVYVVSKSSDEVSVLIERARNMNPPHAVEFRIRSFWMKESVVIYPDTVRSVRPYPNPSSPDMATEAP